MQHSPPAMPRDAVGHLRRALTVLVVALAAIVVLLGSGMSVARAHDELVATTPAPDTTVPTPPASVTLRFSQAVQSLGTQVLVTGPVGDAVAQPAAQVSDATVVQPLADGAPAGVYTVSWRVTSSDGHPLAGEFAFTVAEGAQAAGQEEPAATSGTDVAEVREAAAQEPLDSSSRFGPIAIGAALLAVAGGLAVLLRRRRM
jgi:methionine-rich copper-binding protein CopC